MNKSILKNIEWWILIAALILCIIGSIALYSATQSTNFDNFKKQLIWIAVSVVIMIAFTFIDYEILVKLSPIFYRYFNNIINSGAIYKIN